MKTIDWTLEHNTHGCDLNGSVEVEDDATEADIEALVREDMWNLLSLSWRARGEE